MNPFRISYQVADVNITGYPTLPGIAATDIPEITAVNPTLINGRGIHRGQSGSVTVDHVYSKRRWVVELEYISVDDFTSIRQAHDLQLSNNSVVQINVLEGCGTDYLTGGFVDVLLEFTESPITSGSVNAQYYEDIRLTFTEL